MDDFIAARSQMALSLGFHIIFSCIGMVMPFFMAVSRFLSEAFSYYRLYIICYIVFTEKQYEWKGNM